MELSGNLKEPFFPIRSLNNKTIIAIWATNISMKIPNARKTAKNPHWIIDIGVLLMTIGIAAPTSANMMNPNKSSFKPTM
jgi:hypothetical protein